MLESFILPLPNGEIACARPIQPADKVALHTAFQRLSDESKYGRFLTMLGNNGFKKVGNCG